MAFWSDVSADLNPAIAAWDARFGTPTQTPGATPGVTPGAGIGSNIGSGGDLASLTNLINSLNQGNQQTANAGRIAGGVGLQDQSTGNIRSALGGQVPLDVINQLSQQSAQRGVMTGSPGGASTNADYLRSFGLTSLGMMGQGEQWLTGALARNPAAQVTDAGDIMSRQDQLKLQRDQLAQQRYIAEMANQTNRYLGSLRGASGGGYGGSSGGGAAKPPAPTVPQFPPQPNTSGGGGATQTGSTTSNDIWDPLMWDYFPELMYQGDWGNLNAFSDQNYGFDQGMNVSGNSFADQNNLDAWETWGDTWW